MRIAVVNFNSKKNIDDNAILMKKYICNAINNKVNFIIFPELCLIGYQYYMDNTGLLNKEKLDNVISSLLEISTKNNIYICFGSPYFNKDKIFNSAVITCPDNTVKIYNKIHLYGDEHKIFSKGIKPLILETEFGKLGFGICYDTISFPELIRYYAYNGVNLYINLSAIQLSNVKNSKDYLKRVIEYHVQSNGIYLASSNVCGVQNDEKFLGGSCVVGPDMLNEIPVHYYCNSKLSIKANIFIADIKLDDNLRFVYDGNRFNQIPDFNVELYKSWYN
jgi:predicted amidohydrolase